MLYKNSQYAELSLSRLLSQNLIPDANGSVEISGLTCSEISHGAIVSVDGWSVVPASGGFLLVSKQGDPHGEILTTQALDAFFSEVSEISVVENYFPMRITPQGEWPVKVFSLKLDFPFSKKTAAEEFGIPNAGVRGDDDVFDEALEIASERLQGSSLPAAIILPGSGKVEPRCLTMKDPEAAYVAGSLSVVSVPWGKYLQKSNLNMPITFCCVEDI